MNLSQLLFITFVLANIERDYDWQDATIKPKKTISWATWSFPLSLKFLTYIRRLYSMHPLSPRSLHSSTSLTFEQDG